MRNRARSLVLQLSAAGLLLAPAVSRADNELAGFSSATSSGGGGVLEFTLAELDQPAESSSGGSAEPAAPRRFPAARTGTARGQTGCSPKPIPTPRSRGGSRGNWLLCPRIA